MVVTWSAYTDRETTTQQQTRPPSALRFSHIVLGRRTSLRRRVTVWNNENCRMAGSKARRHNIAHPCQTPSSSAISFEQHHQHQQQQQQQLLFGTAAGNNTSNNNGSPLNLHQVNQHQSSPNVPPAAQQRSLFEAQTQHPQRNRRHDEVMVTAEHQHHQAYSQNHHHTHALQLQPPQQQQHQHRHHQHQDQYQYPHHHPRFGDQQPPPEQPANRQHVVNICMGDDDDADDDDDGRRLGSTTFAPNNCESGSGRPSSRRQSNKNPQQQPQQRQQQQHSINSQQQPLHHRRPLSLRTAATSAITHEMDHPTHTPTPPPQYIQPHGQQPHLRQAMASSSSNNALSIAGDDHEAEDDDDGDEEADGEPDGQPKRVRHRRHRRPLYRRLFSYVRSAWTAGVNFSSSNDSEAEELDTPIRYRPDSLSALCRTTRFTEAEIKRIYRGFKAECPSGVVKEDTFKLIYAQFFPQGANTGLYAHYVFNTLDQDHSGIVSFEEFVHGLSTLSRGSIEEKLQWTFALYDINGDGYITRDEMTDIVTAIYELMGRHPDSPGPDMERIKDKVESIFRKMDRNCDGVVTMDEFIECCRTDDAISKSINVFDTSF